MNVDECHFREESVLINESSRGYMAMFDAL